MVKLMNIAKFHSSFMIKISILHKNTGKHIYWALLLAQKIVQEKSLSLVFGWYLP